MKQNHWRGFIWLTVLLVAALFGVEWQAGKLGAPADELRLSILVALGLGLGLVVLLLLIVDRGVAEPSPAPPPATDLPAETAELAHRCHLRAVEAAADGARRGALDPRLVELANQLEALERKIRS